MFRRQFLQALNASGMGVMFPASKLTTVVATSAIQTAFHLAEKKAVAVAETDGTSLSPRIGIVSVGGIGGTCLPTARERAVMLVSLTRTLAIHTYGVDLHFMRADRKLLVGDSMHLLDANAYGRLAVSVRDQIAEAVGGLDMVLLVAGLGGTTGAGIAPIVAQVLREQNILTLAFAVMPFAREGAQCEQIAQVGLRELRPHVDALFPYFNDDFALGGKKVQRLSTAAQQARLTFLELCRSILNPVCGAAWVNIDFEDLGQIIRRQEGDCAFGIGAAIDADGGAAATLMAIDHPTLGRDRLSRASAVFVAIRAAPQAITLGESLSVLEIVRKELPPNADALFGVDADRTLDDVIVVSILANGVPLV